MLYSHCLNDIHNIQDAHKSVHLPRVYVFSGQTTRVFNRPPGGRGRLLNSKFLVLPDPFESYGFLAESGRPFCTTCILDKIEYTRRPSYALFEGVADLPFSNDAQSWKKIQHDNVLMMRPLYV